VQTRIDHLVMAGPDLAELVDHVAELTGAQAQEGGSHEGLGTRNALLGLGGLRYLELVGPDPQQPAPAAPRPFGVDGLTEPRLVGWAVRTQEISALVRAARRSGYDPGDVVPMSRRRTDGELLSWKVTRLTGGLGGYLPFVIDWLDTVHPSEGLPLVELVRLDVTHPQIDELASGLRALRLRTGAPVRLSAGDRPAMSAVLNTAEGRVRLG
jgi:hypothetical protein